MTRKLWTISPFVCLVLSAASAQHAEILADHAASLLAVQLYSEVAPSLSKELADQTRATEETDALVFELVDRIARCSIEKLQAKELPQIESFVELLTRNDQMSSVTHALSRMFTEAELNEMQFEVSRIVQSCEQAVLRKVVTN